MNVNEVKLDYIALVMGWSMRNRSKNKMLTNFDGMLVIFDTNEKKAYRQWQSTKNHWLSIFRSTIQADLLKRIESILCSFFLSYSDNKLNYFWE